MAKISTVQDTFHGATLNTSLWATFGSYTIAENSTGLHITSTTASNYSGINNVYGPTYDLTGSYAYCRVSSLSGITIPSLEVYPIVVGTNDSANQLLWYISPYYNVCRAFKKVSYTSTQIGSDLTYNAATMKWFRIREQSGTTYWDTSPDGITWTNRFSVANPITITAVVGEILCGNYNTESSTTTITFDYFNILPVTNNGNFFQFFN